MSDRLRLAVENGQVTLPDGKILVINPSDQADVSFLDKATTTLWSRSAKTQAALGANGWAFVGTPTGDFSAVIVCLPKEKAAQRAYLSLALRVVDGPVIVTGDKKDGIDAMYRDLRTRLTVSDAWSKAHGKVFSVLSGPPPDWPLPVISRHDDGWWRAPGVFSADGIDAASQLLAEALPDTLSGRVIDLGAGWGYLAHAALQHEGVAQVHLVEDDALALGAAERNIDDARARFHHADALAWSPETPVDHVVTNPPFHIGRASQPALGQGFIRTAARLLQRNGTLWLVANRQLPYEATLEETFRDVHLLKETAQFKLYRAERPRARRKG